MSASPSSFFSGQTHHLLECFYIITAELLWWHTTNVGLCFYILLQSAVKLDGGLLRHTFWILHITLGSANPSCNERVEFRSGDFSINWYFNEWGNNSHCSSSESHTRTLLQTQMSSYIPQVQIGNAVLSSGHQLPICVLPHTVQIMLWADTITFTIKFIGFIYTNWSHSF